MTVIIIFLPNFIVLRARIDDSVFSGGSDQFLGAKATFGDNLLSETLGDLGLGEDSSGSSTNRNLKMGLRLIY